jgi:hypothetical protein
MLFLAGAATDYGLAGQKKAKKLLNLREKGKFWSLPIHINQIFW